MANGSKGSNVAAVGAELFPPDVHCANGSAETFVLVGAAGTDDAPPRRSATTGADCVGAAGAGRAC